ncbi:MAG: hypothetical protein ABJH68_00360 [Ilumatobacter sp.]|uniref:hypothetical protein n=1 Tax=Ilumatobacter sp. TaxID=1967498 RepID=UPI00329885CC
MTGTTSPRNGGWRSRWAAIGAAIAVTLGAGGMVAVDAATSAPSSVITVTPTRILDTRTDVGLAGPFVSGVSQKLQGTGTVPTQPPGGAAPVGADVVPVTATAVVLNVTVVRPATTGFLSIRPGDATGDPSTSNINWAAGGANIANSVTVQLPTSGQIDIFVSGTASDVLIDVAGYMIPAASGPPGPKGDQGDPGPQGEQGEVGPHGPAIELAPVGRFTPRQIVKGATLECGSLTPGAPRTPPDSDAERHRSGGPVQHPDAPELRERQNDLRDRHGRHIFELQRRWGGQRTEVRVGRNAVDDPCGGFIDRDVPGMQGADVCG